MIGSKIISAFNIGDFVKVVVEDTNDKGANKVFFGTITDLHVEAVVLELNNKKPCVAHTKYLMSIVKAEKK